MKMKFLFVVALLGLASADEATLRRKQASRQRPVLGQFKKFVQTHEKKYETKDEFQTRMNIFEKNLKIITAHNQEYKQGKHTHWMKVGPFADLTPEEFKRDVVGSCFNAFNQTREAAPGGVHVRDPTVKIPDSIDWTAQGKVTPVKNQGQCGSCWAFSTTGSIESRYAIAKGQLNSLSEQELVDCSSAEGNQGCNGGLMDNGFKFVVKEGGLCTEDEYPYDARTGRTCKENKCNTIDDKIASYKDVQPDSEESLAEAVAQGPVSVAIEADQASFQHYGGGILSSRCGRRLDHGVLAVGYGEENGTKYWKVKNSWGASWGDKGYIRLCKDCGKNRKAGECGIAAQPSYPVV